MPRHLDGYGCGNPKPAYHVVGLAPSNGPGGPSCWQKQRHHRIATNVAFNAVAARSKVTGLDGSGHLKLNPMGKFGSELLADIDNAQFWKLATATLDAHQLANDKGRARCWRSIIYWRSQQARLNLPCCLFLEVYERVIQEVERFLDPLAMDVFKVWYRYHDLRPVQFTALPVSSTWPLEAPRRLWRCSSRRQMKPSVPILPCMPPASAPSHSLLIHCRPSPFRGC